MKRLAPALCMLAAALAARESELPTSWVWRPLPPTAADGSSGEPGEWLPVSAGNAKATDFSLARQLAEDAGRNPVAREGFRAESDIELGAVFVLPEAHRGRRNVELVFDRLDTFAEVYVDGKLVLETANAFRSWSVPLPPSDAAERQLLIRLARTDAEAARRESLQPRALPGGARTVARRPQLGFGGPVGPPVLDLSVAYPRLRSWEGAAVRADAVLPAAPPVLAREGAATVCARADVRLELEVDADAEAEGTLSVRCREASVEAKVSLRPGRNRITLPFTLVRPPLWWPTGMGDQAMCEAGWILRWGDQSLAGSTPFGVRDLRLARSVDERGESFRLEANGRRFDARGAHLLPASALRPHQADLGALQLARDAGLNLVRVWAGGAYAGDDLLRQCDAWGILVWQDLPFVDALYPLEGTFLADAKAEVAEQALRMRRHPSLAVWCGITGATERWEEDDWPARLGSNRAATEESARLREVFGRIIPAVLAESDPGRIYLEGSPGKSWRHESSLRAGDLWYRGWDEAMESSDTAQSRVGRFVSGFGAVSHPSPAAARTWSGISGGRAHPGLFLPGGPPAERLAHRLGQEGLRPEGEAAQDFASRWLQAEAIRILASAHRADPGCAGSVVWHLNDTWPTASASLIDFTGAPKPAYFALRRAHDPETVRLWFERDAARAQGVGGGHGVLLRLLDAGGRVVRETRAEGGSAASLDRLRHGEAAYALAEAGPHRLIRPLPPAYRGADPRMAKASYRITAGRPGAAGFGFVDLTVEAETVVVGLCLEPLLPGALARDGLIDLLPGERHVIRARLGEARDWRASFRPVSWHDLGVVPRSLGDGR